MSSIVLRIVAPQLLALLAYVLLRRRLMIAQLAAVVVAALSAFYAGRVLESIPRFGAFLALELFVALLAQLLIAGANEPQQ